MALKYLIIIGKQINKYEILRISSIPKVSRKACISIEINMPTVVAKKKGFAITSSP